MKKIVCAVMALLISILAVVSQAATEYRIDINDVTDSLTQEGWTGLDAPHSEEGGSVTVDGVTFTLSANVGARLRPGNAADTNLNALIRDFVYNDANGGDIRLQIGDAGDLSGGIWKVEIYADDVEHDIANLMVIYREDGVEHLLSSYVEESQTGPIFSFLLYSNGFSSYDIIVRENGNNKNRLCAVSLKLVEYKIDINDALNPVTNEGWTALNIYTNSGSAVVDGINFHVGSVDNVRLRGSVTAPDPDALYGDHIFDDGSNQAVILFFGTAGQLFSGPWESDLYFYDSQVADVELAVGFRINDSGDEVADNVAESNSGPAYTYQFDSDGGSKYDMFTRTKTGSYAAILNGAILRAKPLEHTDSIMVQFDMDDISGDVSADLGTETTPEIADITAMGITASTMNSLTNWGMDTAANGVNDNISRNSVDGETWWSRGTRLSTGGTTYTEFTLTATSLYDLDFSDGMLVVHGGSGKNTNNDSYQFKVILYRVDEGGETFIDSIWTHVNDGGPQRPVYSDIGFDLSSLGIIKDSMTFRLYFADNSNNGAHYSILDTVTVYADVVPGTPPGTIILVM